MTNVLLYGFSNYWHRRKSSMKTTQGERPPALRGCPQLRSVPSLWSGIGEQSRSISRGLKINKNSAESEVFLVDFPSYRTSRACSLKLKGWHEYPASGWRKDTSKMVSDWNR